MNYQLLKGILLSKALTYEDCAKNIGVSTTTFANKMNGKTNFDIVEINKLTEYLDITKEEAYKIFFTNKLV